MYSISPSSSKLVALISTDVKSSTEITYNHEISALSTIEHHRNILGNLCEIHGGEILASMGDGLILSFDNVDQALVCAIKFQKEILEEIQDFGESPYCIKHRIGIHLGLLESSQEFKSSTILIADKLQHEAEPGGICFSRAVYDALQRKHNFSFIEGDFFVIENLNVKLKLYHYSAAKIYEEQIERQNSEQLETLFSSIQLVAIVFTAIDQYEDLILTKTAKVYNQLSQDFELMEKQCRRFGGRWVKTMGGGALLVFSSALNAVYWATKVQRSFLLTQQSSYKHRIAINLGDIIWKGDDIAGTAVNWAARILAHSPPGGVGMSNAVYDSILSHFPFELYQLDHCLVDLKGIPHPCRIFSIQPKPESLGMVETRNSQETLPDYVYQDGNDLRAAYEKGVRQFTGKVLTRFNLNQLDLSNCDFSNSNLSHIEANNTNLSNANFNYVNLKSSNLDQANLSDSLLKFADLSGANLKQANLRRSNFYSANLRGTDLRGADLTDAHITRFQLSTAIVNHKTIHPDGKSNKNNSFINISFDNVFQLSWSLGIAVLALFGFFVLMSIVIQFSLLIFSIFVIVIIGIYYWSKN